MEPSRINRWVNDGAPVLVRGAGRGKPSRYDVEALREWVAARQERTAESLSLGEERARLTRAQAIKAERENAVREGQLIAREEAIAEGQKVLGAVKGRLLQAPRACVLRGVPREHEATIRAVILEALRELAAWRGVAGPGEGEAA